MRGGTARWSIGWGGTNPPGIARRWGGACGTRAETRKPGAAWRHRFHAPETPGAHRPAIGTDVRNVRSAWRFLLPNTRLRCSWRAWEALRPALEWLRRCCGCARIRGSTAGGRFWLIAHRLAGGCPTAA